MYICYSDPPLPACPCFPVPNHITIEKNYPWETTGRGFKSVETVRWRDLLSLPLSSKLLSFVAYRSLFDCSGCCRVAGHELLLHVKESKVGSWIRFTRVTALFPSSSLANVYPWIPFDLTAVCDPPPSPSRWGICSAVAVVAVVCRGVVLLSVVWLVHVLCSVSFSFSLVHFVGLGRRLSSRVVRMPLIYLFAFVFLTEQYGNGGPPVSSLQVPRESPSLSLLIWSLLSLLCLSSVHRPVTGVPPILIRSILRSWLASLIVIVVCCRPYIVGYAAVSLLLGPCAYSSPWTTPHQYLISSSGSLYLSPCPRDVNARSQMNLSLSLSHTNAHTPVLVLPPCRLLATDAFGSEQLLLL